MMKLGRKRRALAFFLSLVLLATAIPPSIAWAEEVPDTVRILWEGEVTESVLLHEKGELKLTTETDLKGTLFYSWEMLSPFGKWVEISGKNTSACIVNYALVCNVLDGTGNAQIRCTVKCNSETYSSDPVTVSVSYDVSKESIMYAAGRTGESDPPISDSNDIGGMDGVVSNGNSNSNSNSGSNGEVAQRLCTVTIYYQFKQGGNHANPPAVLTYKAGTNVNRYVTSPNIVGYRPVYYTTGENNEVIEQSAESILVRFDDIQEDKNLYIIYLPTQVKYEIHHHRQNLIGDDYEADPFQITQAVGYTGETVTDDCVLKLEGFNGRTHKKFVIAADGSTVVEVYYDRVYYHVDFELDGGFGTNSRYTRYGTVVTADNPQYPGYRFVQWILVSCYGMGMTDREPTQDEKLTYAIAGPETAITVLHNLRYEAIWALDYTSYTVVYWKENADDDNYSFWGSKTVGVTDDGVYNQTVSAGMIVSGQDDFEDSDKQYFTFDAVKSDKNVAVKHDGSTIVNVYYSRNVYQLDFFGYLPSGNCQFEEHTHGNGDCDLELVCNYPEHVHNEECVPLCGKEVHAHSSACCSVPICEVHSASCFSSGIVGSRYNGNTTNFPKNVVDGYIYKTGNMWSSAAYIYVNGSWYTYGKAVNNVSNGDIIEKSCHYAHGEYGCSCTKEAHEHSDVNSCFRDIAHAHTDACYVCHKIQHSHSNGHGNSVLLYVITAKYEQNIGAKWPTYDLLQSKGIAVANSSGTPFYGWQVDGVSSTYVSKRLNMTAELCGDVNVTAQYQRGNQSTYYYLFEDVDQTDSTETPLNSEGKGRILYNNVWYVSDPDYYQVLSSSSTLSAKTVLGMVSQNSSPASRTDANGKSCYCFFYKRATDSDMVLSFYNYDSVDESFNVSDGLKYGMPLKNIASIMSYVGDDSEPGYPKNLEKGGYAFEQWYTTPECFPGTEVDWNTITMPNGGLTVYAKWLPVQHTVNVYTDVTMTEKVYETQIIDHGHHAAGANSITDDTDQGMIFVGWFYMDENGEEQYFKFNSMPVRSSMNIYAKWRSTTLVAYAIYYKTVDGDEVAAPQTGESIAGYNTTFYAAKGRELYEQFREGYFPRVASHSVLMQKGPDGEESYVNVYTFVYEKHEKISYQVHYLDEDDNQLLPSITAEGYFVEVTEIFKPVDGHETDTYSITKVLSTSESNDIVFRYKRTQANATANSPYRVSAYMQDLDDLQHYTELKKKDVCPVEYTAEVGSKPTVNPFLFDGFVLVKAVVKGTNTTLTIKDGVVTGAVLPKEGMEICLYYDRVELSYTVEYHYQYTTSDGQTLTQELIPSETRKGMFGEKIEVAALDLTGIGYGLVSSPTAEVTLNSVATQERIIFVYSENNVVFRYYSVLGKNGTVLSGSETIRAFKGTSEGAAGFLPENTQDYTFVGWYLDERCSFPVTTSDRVLLEDSGKLTPQAVTKTVNGREYLVYEPATYYALYEPNNSKLIIDVVQTTGVSMDQTFLYRIQGTDTNNTHIDLTVAIHGTYIAPVLEIPVGTYKVTEISDWSWRYTPDAIEKTVYVTVDDTRLNFTYTVAEDQWLSGEGFEHYVVPPPAS